MDDNGERMISSGLKATAFRLATKIEKEVNLNINTKTAITYTHCCAIVADY